MKNRDLARALDALSLGQLADLLTGCDETTRDALALVLTVPHDLIEWEKDGPPRHACPWAPEKA